MEAFSNASRSIPIVIADFLSHSLTSRFSAIYHNTFVVLLFQVVTLQSGLFESPVLPEKSPTQELQRQMRFGTEGAHVRDDIAHV